MSFITSQSTRWQAFLIKIDFLRFPGRINRIRHMGLFSLYSGFILLAAFSPKIFPHYDVIAVFFALACVAVAIPNLLFIFIRRLNDFDCSGWWMFLVGILFFIKGFFYIGILSLLVIFCVGGTQDENRFGMPDVSTAPMDYAMILTIPAIYFILHVAGLYS